MRYYVVADVHSFYTELVAALTEKGYFEDMGPKKLVICGDLFDRGGEAQAMQNFVRELLGREEVLLIRGNHEDLLEEFAENLEIWMDSESFLYSHHMKNGTVETMLQLTGLKLEEAFLWPRRARLLLRATPFFREILPAMRDYYETEHYVFVHGWIPAREIGDPPSRYEPLGDFRTASPAEWERARWYNGMLAAHSGVILPNKTIVCGHVPTAYGHTMYEGKPKDSDFSVYSARGILALDGCTAYTDTVNCVILEDEP